MADAPDPRLQYQAGNLVFADEDILGYRRGGYHPACIGDEFKDGRYRVYNKLGYGGFATVWLARDQLKKRWVSLKINVSDDTQRSGEVLKMNVLLDSTRYQPGAERICGLLECFTHHGPNGNHQCLVLELLGPSLSVVLERYDSQKRHLRPQTVLRLAKELLQTVALLHRNGWAHGDISLQNLAFHLSPTSNPTTLLSPPHQVPLTRTDRQPLSRSQPRRLTKTADWRNWNFEDTAALRILDFGESFPRGSEPKTLAEPVNMKIPELLFGSGIGMGMGANLDLRADLWRVGLVIYQLVFRRDPFQPVPVGREDLFIGDMVDFVEPLPPRWREMWIQMKRARGQVTIGKRGHDGFDSELERQFEMELPHPSLKVLFKVIQGLVRFRPQDRISAVEALKLLGSQDSKSTRKE